MRWLRAGVVFGAVILGVVAGWFVGNAMEVNRILDPETFWRTDPENVWGWSAAVSGVVGLGAGLWASSRF